MGLLLTLNAMLLTTPERRRLIDELRTQGFDARRILLLLGFQVLVLGVLASVAGIFLGDALARTLFRQSPAYLEFAFTVSTHQVVHTGTVLVALACGLLASLVASLPAILGVRKHEIATASQEGEAGLGRGKIGVLGALAAVLALTAIASLAAPGLAVVGDVALALLALCLIPPVFRASLHVLGRLGERLHGSMLAVAVAELRATPLHSIGLAGVAAIAVYGSVAVRGAQHDLIHGLDRATAEFFSTASIWVTSGANEFMTTSFDPQGAAGALRRLPEVAAVRTYQGGLLNVGRRRMWIRARPSEDPRMIEAGQLRAGNATRAQELLRRGGWVAISEGLASERHVGVGGRIVLPTPSGPVRFGVAALTTNLGWSPGAITLNAADYRRYWQTEDPTALEVGLRRGASLPGAMRAVRHVLGAQAGLRVQSAQELDTVFDKNVQQGLSSLGEIAALLLIAAALAVASALSATVWQRRARLAALEAPGLRSRTALEGADARERDRAECRLRRGGAARNARPRAGHSLAGADHGLPRRLRAGRRGGPAHPAAARPHRARRHRPPGFFVTRVSPGFSFEE